MTFEDLIALSPFPLVDLVTPEVPRDGFLVATSSECRKNFARDERCRLHYAGLTTKADGLVQCPYGFVSLLVREVRVVVTGMIPYPRLGGQAERARAKRNPHHKVSALALGGVAAAFLKADHRLRLAEMEAARKQSVALHEIRKLNRKVKQTAERLCEKESPSSLDEASPELVRILKTSELMSYQFEVLELLANEALASLPLNTASEIYRIFDKCVRIYQPEGTKERISIHAPAGFFPVVMVCEKTFPIIPTVLIENAIKHSTKETAVKVELHLDRGDCVVRVSNIASAEVQLTPAIFERGVRATSEVEGSGHGLYLAQLVARQHGTTINLETMPWSGGRQRVVFSLRLGTVHR